MNIFNKRKILIIAILLSIILLPVKSNAGLQANKGGKSKESTSISNFFSQIRAMDSTGGTLAVDESYGIDCHMAKNTEWGTAAIMSASPFGTAPSGQSSESTTGNTSGIYQMADNHPEFVAGIYNNTNTNNTVNLSNSEAKYKNNYTNTTKYSITGDGIIETDKWKGAGNYSFVTSSSPVFIRSYIMFGYSNHSGSGTTNKNARLSRGCSLWHRTLIH